MLKRTPDFETIAEDNFLPVKDLVNLVIDTIFVTPIKNAVIYTPYFIGCKFTR